MKIPKVSINDWTKLYEAAIEFKNMRPWLWMSNGDIFGVKNPEDGVTAYCMIMGQMGEGYGITAYIGEEGLQGYFEMMENIMEGNPESIHKQNCLMASFENREFLDKEDLKVIKELGYSFRGKNEWPVFRYFEPGYFPWFLNEYQARFLTVILKQAMEVANIRIKNFDFFENTEEKCMLRYSHMNNEDIIWESETIRLEPTEKAVTIPQFVNEIKLRSLKKGVKERLGTWGVDWFHSPDPVAGDEKPYYPVVVLFVESQSKHIINFELTSNDNLLEKFQEKLVELIEKFNVLPERIFVQKRELFDSYVSIAEKLGVNIELEENNEMLKEIMFGIFETFQKEV